MRGTINGKTITQIGVTKPSSGDGKVSITFLSADGVANVVLDLDALIAFHDTVAACASDIVKLKRGGSVRFYYDGLVITELK